MDSEDPNSPSPNPDVEVPNTSAKDINIEEFNAALSRYGDALKKKVIKRLDNGSSSMEELDNYRYVEAPARFSKESGATHIELADLQRLMDWKLRHGIFRPALPALIRRNSPEDVVDITKECFALYAEDPSDMIPVLKTIAKLKGVGPATASLILAVHDPENVIFFSDEAFRWLANDGMKTDMKYNFKEYKALYDKCRTFIEKLGVSPIDIEKVAFVLDRESRPDVVPKDRPKTFGFPKGRKRSTDEQKEKKAAEWEPGRPQGSFTTQKRVLGGYNIPTASKRGRPIKAITTIYDDAKNAPPKEPRQKKKKKAREIAKSKELQAVVPDDAEPEPAGPSKKKAKIPPPPLTAEEAHKSIIDYLDK